MKLQGKVLGGQQPVSGASIQLYRAGTTGLGSASTSMLTTPVFTDASGSFGITGDYTCNSSEDQVYITATGGNPGLSGGTNNAALAMVTALGRCGDLSSPIYFISINEVTTVAAAWALAPFAQGLAAIGATSTNAAGMRNAFLNAHLLADTAAGRAVSLPAGQAVEVGKLYGLADALSTCVNSSGAGCSPLFSAATPSGGMAPTNTFAAALNVVQHPGNNVAAVFNVIPAQQPFPTTLTQAPNDWTMSLAITNGGLNAPSALGVDPSQNVWVANSTGSLSAFNAQGVPYTSNGYGVGVMQENFGLAIDFNGNVWVSNEEYPSHYPTKGSLSIFQGYGSGSSMGVPLAGNNGYYFQDSTIDYPKGIFADTNGKLMIANSANSSVTVFSPSAGTYTQVGVNNVDVPVYVAADAAHGLWVGNPDDTTITHLDASGNLLSRPNCCFGAYSVTTDAGGNAWAANYFNGSISEVNNAGTTLINQDMDGGLAGPNLIVVDGAQQVWVANYQGASFSGFAGSGASNPAAALSPASGFGTDPMVNIGGTMYPLIDQAYGIAVDGSGDIWVTGYGSNALAMFFGVAAPTVTPVVPNPAAP